MKSCTHLFLSGRHSLGIPSPGDFGVLGTASSEGLASPEGGLPSDGKRWQALRSNGGGMGLTFLPDVVRVRVGLGAAGADVTAAAAVMTAAPAGGDDLTLRSSGVSCGSFISS